jgi:hypothetical protein
MCAAPDDRLPSSEVSAPASRRGASSDRRRTAAAAAGLEERSAAVRNLDVPNYLHQAGGTLEGGFPWSINMVSSSSADESDAETSWSAGIQAAWAVDDFIDLVPAGTELTYTSSSTASSTFRQTTKTTTDLSIVGNATAGLPYQVAEVVTWRTTSATKWGRGRSYLPPLSPTALATAGFLLSTAAQDAIVAAINAALAEWSGTLNLQILHRKTTLDGPAADTLTAISGGDVSNKLVIQKRRGDKYVPTRVALTF